MKNVNSQTLTTTLTKLLTFVGYFKRGVTQGEQAGPGFFYISIVDDFDLENPKMAGTCLFHIYVVGVGRSLRTSCRKNKKFNFIRILNNRRD